MRTWRLRGLLLVTVIFMTAILITQGATAFSQESPTAKVLTLNGAVSTALLQSSGAQRAEITLEQRLIEALTLEHQHEVGPPSETCIVPGLCFGGVSNYEGAQIKELLPEQVLAIRASVQALYLQEMVALQADVIKAYYDALLAQSAVDLHATHQQRLQQHLAQASLALKQGAVAALDVARTEAGLAQAEAEAFAADEQSRLALLALKELVGLPLDGDISLSGTIAAWLPQARDYEQDLANALTVSAEVQAAQGQLDVAEKDMALFAEHAGGFRGRTSYRQRELAVDQARLALSDAQRRTETRVQGIHSQLAQLTRQEAAAEGQATVARRVADLARLQYDLGLVTSVDVLEVEGALLGAELNHLQVLVRAHATEAQLQVLLAETPPQVERRLENIRQKVDDLL